MDIKRRYFFKELGCKTADLAAVAAVPALVQLHSLSDELKALRKDLNAKLSKASAEVKEQVQGLHNRIDGAALTLSYQQMQLSFIFLLLVISFVIDAGMTGLWLLT